MGGAQGPGARHQKKRVLPASGGTEIRSEEPHQDGFRSGLQADSGQGKDPGRVIPRCSPA